MSGGTRNRLGAVAQLLLSAAAELQSTERRAELQATGDRAMLPLADIVRDEHRANLVRSEVLPEAFQSPVAWAIMVELYSAHSEQQRSCVKHVCLASTAPNTTVLRHLRILVNEGWVIRSPSRTDKRLVWLTASDPAIELIEAWAGKRAVDLAKLRSVS